jgi:phage-related protein
MGAFAGVAAGIAAIATPVGGTVALIVALVAAIVGAVLWLKKFISGNSEAALAIRTAWNKFYDTVIAPLVQSFQDLWVKVVEAFNQIKNAIMKDTSSWSSWGTFIKNALKVTLGTIIVVVGLIIGAIKTIVDVVGPVFKAIVSFISGIIKIFKGLTDFLVGVFTGDWKRAWEGIKLIWDGIWDAIIGVLANVGEAIWKLIKGIYNTVVNAFKAMYDILVGHSIVPDMVNAILMWFKRLLDKAKAPFIALGTFVAGLYSKYFLPFVQKIADMVGKVVDKFRDIVTRVKGTFQNFSLYKVGTDLINGLINGIQDMAGRLFTVASNIASTVIDKVSGIFDIGSPSKVFYKIGQWNMEGLAKGMKEGLPGVLTSAGGVSKAIPSVSPTFGSVADPLMDKGGLGGPALAIENYYANDNVDPWRQSEDWYFMITSRGGVA